MSRSFIAILSVAFLALDVAVAIFVNPYLIDVVVFAGMLFVGLFCLVVSVPVMGYATFRKDKGQSIRLYKRILVDIAFVSIVIFGLILPVNWVIAELAVASAKAYPEKVAPQMEDYRLVNGRYPPRLDQLTGPKIPRLLEDGYICSSDGSHFSFRFSPPGLSCSEWEYSDGTHAWHYEDF